MWKDIKTIQSADANVMKYVFSSESAVAEAVLYKYPTYEERTVICCSTQSGCPVGCRFCGAGDNFVRSLISDEIVSQVTHLFESQNIDPTKVERCQIMFMSMGEPMLNFKALASAIRELHVLYPKARLLISTSGPDVDYQGVIDLSVEVPAVGLQFSVHESTDEARDALVPFKKKLTLAQIAEVGERWGAATGRSPFFNYCAHDKNSSQEDADRVAALYKSEVWEATISVVCEREESIAAANERQRELANGFQSKLQGHGFSTRMFDPAGQDDIGGGCGQLWFVQQWMRDNPDKARPSVGFRLPVIHAPQLQV